jgi:type III pantothenate kinase
VNNALYQTNEQQRGGTTMVLAVDIGNTNIVIGVFKNENLEFIARVETNKGMTTDEYAIKLKGIFELYNVDVQAIDGAIISSVVPPLTKALADSVKRLTGKTPLVVGPGIKTGLNILIDNPAQLGSDLVVDSVAALAKYPRPIVIFDMGTATTISVLNATGSFMGGAIFPGVRLSLDALSDRTAQLPHISIDAPEKVVGTNTIDCMKSGLVFGNAAMVDGMIDHIEAEIGEVATIVATGGLSEEIVKHCRHKVIHNGTLLLEGLYLLYLKNRPH